MKSKNLISTTVSEIAAFISFCTNDYRCLKKCLSEVGAFASRIAISTSDHFFDGTVENLALLEHVYATYPMCHFIEVVHDPSLLSKYFAVPDPFHAQSRAYWHEVGRLALFLLFQGKEEYLLFLDVDEVPRGGAFAQWTKERSYLKYEGLRFAAYAYFREARFCSETVHDTALLLRRSAVKPDMLWSLEERMGTYLRVKGDKKRGVAGLDGIALFDHYSWVKTKEEMIRKAESWGHFWERDWHALIEEEFVRPFSGVDFVRHYRYREIAPSFDPLHGSIPSFAPISLEEHRQNMDRFPNVKRLGLQELFRLNVQWNANVY